MSERMKQAMQRKLDKALDLPSPREAKRNPINPNFWVKVY